MACVAAAGVACATFDAFGFPQVAGVLFFAVGCIAALRRHSLEPSPRRAMVRAAAHDSAGPPSDAPHTPSAPHAQSPQAALPSKVDMS